MARRDEDWCGQAMLFHWLSQIKVGTNQKGFPKKALSTVTATRQAAMVQRQQPIQAVTAQVCQTCLDQAYEVRGLRLDIQEESSLPEGACLAQVQDDPSQSWISLAI